MQKSVPCTIMRGGTSKGVFFRKENLPADLKNQDAVIMAAFGSPDPVRPPDQRPRWGHLHDQQGRHHQPPRGRARYH